MKPALPRKDIDPARTYLVSGATMGAIMEALGSLGIEFEGADETRLPWGRRVRIKPGSGSGSARCPQLLPALVPVDEALRLRVTAGLVDGWGAVPAYDAEAPENGVAWLRMTATLTKAGTALAGYFPAAVAVTAAEIGHGSAMPANTPFPLDLSSSAPETGGVFHYQLAEWAAGEMTASGSGNVAIAWCWGVPTFGRYC